MNTSIYQKNLKFYLLTLALVFLAIVASFFWFSSYYQKTVLEDYKTSVTTMLTQELNKKFDLVKAAAVSYANYSLLREAMAHEDREVIAREIQPMHAQFAKWTDYKRYAFHFITADGRSLYKSYDEPSYGQDLTFHPMIDEVIRTQLPTANMGVGGVGAFYRIIAIQPVFDLEDSAEVVGFVAVSQGLRRLVKDIPNFGYEYSLFVADKTTEEQSSNRTFSLDQRSYFKDSSLKALTFQENEVTEQTIIDIKEHLIYISPLLDAQKRPVAFHAVSLPKAEFHQRVWEQEKSLLLILLVLFSVVALLGGLHVFRVKRDMVKPLTSITNNIRSIIETKDYKQKVQHNQDDEIGELTNYFNDLLDTTDHMVFSLSYLEQAVDKTLIVSKTDPFGTITYVNEKFCKISGYSPEELVGHSHSVVRHPDMPSSVFEDIWKTIQNKQTWSGEITNLAKDGSTYYVNSHILPVLDYKNNIIGYLSIREDVTLTVNLRKQLEDNVVEIEHKKKAAEEANSAKSEFLSSMSHELRTPLNAIIGFSQLLEISDLTEPQLKRVKNIEASGQHLLDLINDILEFAKIDAGSLSLSIEKVAVYPIISEIFALSQSQAEQDGISLDIEDPKGTDYLVEADRVRLKQVCLNLLSNAIKYNRKNGQIFIRCEVAEKEQKQYWQFMVRDTGLGIPKEQINDLFEPFNRLGHEGSNIEGTGIGLSITKSLVEKMHGWIEVESEEGVGSTFSIFLPLIELREMRAEFNPQEHLHKEKKDETTAEQHSDAIRVHYIEDNPANMELMLDIVNTMQGVELKISPTAEDGIEQASVFKPHIMFVDINLPGMDGDEALGYLKEQEALKQMGTRFYALSANVMAQQIQKGMDAGFEKYLTKPINVKEIISLIQDVKK